MLNKGQNHHMGITCIDTHCSDILQVNHKHLLITVCNLLLNWELEAPTTRQILAWRVLVDACTWETFLQPVARLRHRYRYLQSPAQGPFPDSIWKWTKSFWFCLGIWDMGCRNIRERIDLFHPHSWRLYWSLAETSWMLGLSVFEFYRWTQRELSATYRAVDQFLYYIYNELLQARPIRRLNYSTGAWKPMCTT